MATWWDRIVVYFAGKDVAILGPRAAGKTTLYDFLEYGTVESRDGRTQTVSATQRGIVRHRNLPFTLHKGADVPGSDVHYPVWRTYFDKADIVLYVFNAHLARTDAEYAVRMAQDGRKFKEWGAENKRVFLVGTHRDADPLSKRCTPATYSDKILELDVIEAFRSRVNAETIAVGEMSNDRSTLILMRQVVGR